MTDDFVHLHVHTEYSMLDGAAALPKLVGRAIQLGQRAVAITDHGNLHGAYAFYKECLNQGVKPIIGMEAYCAPGYERASERSKAEGYSGSGAYSHLTIHAQTSEGLRNLFRLSSQAYSEGFYYKPRIDLQQLDGLKQGLVVSTGCLSGELSVRLQQEDYDGADAYVSWMRDHFQDNFYIELMEHGFEREQVVLKRLLEVAKRHGVPTLGTNDSHYVGPADSILHDAMLCLQTRARLSDENRMRFDGSGYYLKARAEIDLPKEALDNTLVFAERIEEYDFSYPQRMPRSKYPDPVAELERRLLAVYPGDAEHQERRWREFDTICKLGFPDYFLVLADLIGKARLTATRFGPGRGSAGGSLVAYDLGITELEPITHDLLFERFLNEDRISLPDIDIDIDDTRREEFLNLVREEYGEANTAHIGTIGTIGAKAALKDSARVLGYSFQTGTELTWALPRAEFGRQPALSDANWSKSPVHPDVQVDVLRLAEPLEGLARQPGVHASGFIISPEPLIDYLPTWNKAGKGPAVTQWDQHAVEALGFVKFDFLGVKTLGVIDDCVRLLSEQVHGGTAPRLVCDPEGCADQRTFDLLAGGFSTGTFQLDGSGMQRLLQELLPRTIHDLAAVLALYRPGPMGTNAHREYAARKNGRSGVVYPHPELRSKLAPVLGSTYGLFVYQEQVMKALQVVCGYTLKEADEVRRIMGKKQRDKLLDEEVRFYEHATIRGDISEAAAKSLWETLVPFADYGFPKAHAYGYGYVAYWTAFLKANHPKEWFASLLTKEEDPDKITEYINEVRRMGYAVLPPDINESSAVWTPTESGVRYGLATIKGVGEKVIASLSAGVPYDNWADYLRRAPSAARRTNIVNALCQAGAYDSFGSREGLLNVYVRHLEEAANEREALRTGQRPLFPSRYEIPSLGAEWDVRKRGEIATLGVAVSEPPLHVSCPVSLSIEDWRHVREMIEKHPGSAALTIHCGGWEMHKGLVSPENFLKSVAPLGIHQL